METIKLNLTNTNNKNILIKYLYYINLYTITIQVGKICLFKIRLKIRTSLASLTNGGNELHTLAAKKEKDL